VIHQLVEADAIHFAETQAWSVLIGMNSLREEESDA
jgi:hypothetical protein